MVRRNVPKTVRLPDGRTFKARFRRATRDELTPNVTFNRKYKQRAAPKGKRRRKQGKGFKSALGKAFQFAKKIANNKTVRGLVRMGVAEIPGTIIWQSEIQETKIHSQF